MCAKKVDMTDTNFTGALESRLSVSAETRRALNHIAMLECLKVLSRKCFSLIRRSTKAGCWAEGGVDLRGLPPRNDFETPCLLSS